MVAQLVHGSLPTLYFGCAFTNATPHFEKFIRTLKKRLADDGKMRVLEFVVSPEETPEEVYDHDINDCIRNCHAMIADLTESSTGLGMEIVAAAALFNKPVLGIANRAVFVSRLPRGMPKFIPTFAYATYADADEAYALCAKFIDSVL